MNPIVNQMMQTMFANNPIMQMYKTVMNAQNPAQIMQNFAQQNPPVQQVLSAIKRITLCNIAESDSGKGSRFRG